MSSQSGDGHGTRGDDYTRRLIDRTRGGWREALDVQRPYRWNLRRLEPGRCLDIGCGIGRNLAHLPAGSIGVDHNPTSVETCRDHGLEAYTSETFLGLADVGTFDSLLVAHVLEHLDEATARSLVDGYLPYLRQGGRIIVITPQERGFASDATHVRWVGFDETMALFEELDLEAVRTFSFPFPRVVGRYFYANEFVSVARRATSP